MSSCKPNSASATTPLDVSIIVVSYNTKDMTLKCLESVYKETEKFGFELIVVDNASSDGSAEAIAEHYSEKAIVHCLDENLGFAAANNFAARKASGDYLLLLNPDTEVLDGAIDNLLSFAKKNEEAKIWGGRTLFADGKLNPTSCWTKMNTWALLCQACGLSSLFRNSPIFNVEGMGGWDRMGERQVDIVTGCFFLIPRPFWEKLGGFDKDFFMYGEEADLCLRAAKLGAKPMVSSTATIIHHGGASETVRSDKLIRLLTAKIKLIRKHFSASTRSMAELLLVLWPLSRYIAHSILSILGRSESKKGSKTWGNVWRERKIWTA